MRRRAALPATLALLFLAAPAAAPAAPRADEQALSMYRVTVDQKTVGELAAVGVDLTHTGFDADKQAKQDVLVDILPRQARALEADGLELDRLKAATLAPSVAARSFEPGSVRGKPETGGDSPNPFYDVYRSYSEPGGVADELRALAAAHPENAKLVQIGTSLRGKPILAVKVTRDARNTPDGARPAVLYSGVNHAREWIAAETARRLPRWFLEHADDPKVERMLGSSELWFLPIMNPDGYDYTFTCGIGDGSAANFPCGSQINPATGNYAFYNAAGEVVDLTRSPINRLWRKTLRDNDGNGTFGDGQDGVDPNRNYPTAWDLDQEGASNVRSSQTYRGPGPLSEPENLAYDRLLRLITPEALINYHSAAQLLLYPFGFITDVSSDDNPWYVALTGTDGDAAVDPYISERSSDLYVTNGETTDHAYNKYKTMSWTPELDECVTGGGGNLCTAPGGSGFTFPDDETKVRAVFDKNLDFVLNVATTVLDRDRPDRPRNATNEPSGYQVKPSVDIEANAFGVSFGSVQPIEANVRRILGNVDVELNVAAGPGGAARRLTLPMSEWEGGERFGDLRGKYYRRVRAVPPANFVQPGANRPEDVTPRPLVAGDVVSVVIRAGGQRQRFAYRVASTRPAGDAKRVLVVAAEDYTGVSPNRDPYASAPRYLDEYVDAIPKEGYTVETYDLDAPPAGPAGAAGSKYLSQIGVLQHFDAVVFETGDDLVPQDLSETVTATTYRRPGAAAGSLTGSTHIARYGPRNWQALRDYLNEGGKLVFAGRNLMTAQTSTSTALTAYSGYTWFKEPDYGFNYPPRNGGDDDRPGTAFFRELANSNDFGQYFLGIASRQAGYGTDTYAAAAVSPDGGGIFAGLEPLSLDTSATAGGAPDPTQGTDGSATPVAKVPTRLRSLTGVVGPAGQRAIRQERVELDYAAGVPADAGAGGAAISTADTVTFGFGLEQADPAARAELMRRSLAHLAPAGADTVAPTARFLRPGADATVTPRDPVEIEVDAADDRGDLADVRLFVGGALVGRKVSFPHQLRWTPTAADVGRTVVLRADVRDRAGNVTTVERSVSVVSPESVLASPVPIARPTLSGLPVVGRELTCLSGGFSGGPTELTYAWLRNGVPIAGATGSRYTPTSEDLGLVVACRVTGRNAAGAGDATSEGRVISFGGGTGAAGTAGRTTAANAAGAAISLRVACGLVDRRTDLRCTIRQLRRSRAEARETITGTVRVQGRSARATGRARGKVTVTLRGSRRLGNRTRAVVDIRVGSSERRAVLAVGRARTLG